MAHVVFEQVTKRYDNGFVAVNNLNLEIGETEFLVLVGPSGCGKTTSLRMLAGLEEISSGNIYINNNRVNTLSPRERDIAMVFQSYALYPHMTVFQNMAFSLELKGTPKSEIRQRVVAAAQQLGIEDLLDRKPKQLSGGQRQRVAVGRATVRNPAVFLMDEPLSNLDAKLRVQARAELNKLHKKLETTFIYVTHDQVEAMTMGTRIAVMNQGILQQVDTPAKVYESPRNVFVAGFLGSPSMNFLEGVILPTEDNLVVKTDCLTLPITPDQQQHYEDAIHQPIILGIRPESIYHPAYVPPGIQPFKFETTISVVEPMGHEQLVYFSLDNGQELVARQDPRAHLVPGETLTLVLDLNRMHLFDRESKQALLP